MNPGARRFFWGHTLAQAVTSAARYFQLPPERLAYRLHGKRHGFVKHPRAVVIEIDPAAPDRGESAVVPAAPAPVRPAAPRAPRPSSRPAAPRPPAPEEEPWDAPDDEAEAAAREALRQLGRLAGLALDGRFERTPDRFEIELVGDSVPRLGELGLEFLEELEHLLPRAIVSLSGRRVRCRLDAGGLRAAREEALRARAREAAARVRESGEDVLLDPLNPAERRIVHLELQDLADVATESLGNGYQKRVRVFAPPPSGR